MGIILNQTYAKIGIENTPGELQMQTRHPKVEINQQQAQIQMKSELPRVMIDQYEAFASAGLKGTLDLTREIAARAHQQSLNYIAQTAEDGDQLADIASGGNPIVSIAVRRAYPMHEYGCDYLPKVGPEITVAGGMLEVWLADNGPNNGVEVTNIEGDVDINYTPSSLSIYMKQYQSLKISYQPDNKIDVRL
ncbi:hypothetical protein DFR58_11414 [Anaerobacterium chartisolvens]|uniref:Uncharacterized protein n=1 Tax=Anaerobacterium chartisolvens TaxID=1297424 RepID=A0A369AZC1_9FIRM|nr:DUF6470 family protein [Anaerobacterium chartisolvens]RCX14780.1 hypothetical protein DFR58_11414 [Anaerobacterium chartisolvens]